MAEWTLLIAGGLLAGTLGGLLGIGGGVVLMPLLRFFVGLSPAYAAGTCILAVFCTTLGGCYRHYRLGHVRFKPIRIIIIAGATATVLFSFAFQYLALREKWLDLGIGLVFSLVAGRMIFEGLVKNPMSIGAAGEEESTDNTIQGTAPVKVSIGAVAGMLPGLLGIGTGGILVPAFTFILRTPVKIAMGSSLTCFCFNAFISSSFKLAQGFIDLGIGLPICVGTLLGANLGAVLNKQFSPRSVKLLFGFVFSYVSLKFILSFFEVRL